jgi:signal transduction histidine kinase
VVQTLAGVSYSLSAAAGHVHNGNPPKVASLIDEAATDTRQSIRELRTLLVDIYPPALQRAGLKAALSDLLVPLRNVDKHAAARHVRVSAGRRNGHALLSVQDDGRGFSLEPEPAADGEQAIALAYERAPDVVVMDLEMPRVGRPSCCRASGRRPTASRRCTRAPPAPS